MGALLQQPRLLQLRPAGTVEALLPILRQRLQHRKVATAALRHSLIKTQGVFMSTGMAAQPIWLPI